MNFFGPLWIFVGCYGSVTHTSDVTVYANTEILRKIRHRRAILIVINFIIYKLYIFATIGN